jgi:hypothetical protein
MGGHDFTTCKPSPPHFPGSEHTRAPGSRTRELLVSDKHQQSRVLEKRQHLMPSTTRHDHRHPRAPDSRYLSNGSRPITVWHRNSTTRACIIVMITLTQDKDTLVKVDFSIRDTVHQGPERSTPHQVTWPGDITPLGKVDESSIDPRGTMGWNIAYRKALYPCLSATVRRTT